MKKIDKFIATVCSLAAISATSVIPMSASAIAMSVTNPDTGITYSLGYYDRLVGWNEDGTPIIHTEEPKVEYHEELGYVYGYTPLNALIPDEDPSESTETPIEDETTETPVEDDKDENGLYNTPTGVRGDVNYDGLVNNIDVMVLRKYILHLIEW